MHGDKLVASIVPKQYRHDNFFIYQVGLYVRERADDDFVWGEKSDCGPTCAERYEHDAAMAASVDATYADHDEEEGEFVGGSSDTRVPAERPVVLL